MEINPLIIKALQGKATMHLEILDMTNSVFLMIKKQLTGLRDEINASVTKNNKKLKVEIKDRSNNEIDFTIASDTLIFLLHSNIFIFDQDHTLWKTSYLKDNPLNAHCGMISIYNFLSDSFTFNRTNDIGLLVARIFVNKDLHFYVEGKRQLGFLFNDLEKTAVTEAKIKDLLDNTILHCLEFDIYTPPFDAVSQVTIQEILNTNLSSTISTGKRLGFRLQSGNEPIT